MHPEHSAMMSQLVMEDRHREAESRRLRTAAGHAGSKALRTRLGALLVRIGTRLETPPQVRLARRA